MNKNIEDVEIIKKILAGSSKEFEKLVIKYQKQLYYTVYSIVHNEQTAEDIVQDTFVQAFKKLKTLKEPVTFSKWISRIAVNNSLNHLAKNKNSVIMEDNEDEQDFFENIPFDVTPEDDMIREEEAGIIHTLIDKLPEKLRVVLVMREFDNFSYEEISDILKIPVGTVRSRLFAARSVLKDQLEAKGYKG